MRTTTSPRRCAGATVTTPTRNVPGDCAPRMWAVVHQGRADDMVMVGRQTIERWPFDGSSLAGAAVATLATAEYVSGEPHRAIARAESTLSALAAASLAAVTLRRVLGQARHAVGDVPGALAASATAPTWPGSSTCRRWPSSSTSPTPRRRPTTGGSRRRCQRSARERRRVGPPRVGRHRGVGPLLPGLGPLACRSRVGAGGDRGHACRCRGESTIRSASRFETSDQAPLPSSSSATSTRRTPPSPSSSTTCSNAAPSPTLASSSTWRQSSPTGSVTPPGHSWRRRQRRCRRRPS